MEASREGNEDAGSTADSGVSHKVDDVARPLAQVGGANLHTDVVLRPNNVEGHGLMTKEMIFPSTLLWLPMDVLVPD